MRPLSGGGFTFTERAALLAPLAAHDKVALAVSGGPDSYGLLALVADWSSDGYSTHICVYCVNHQLRPEAAAEAEAVMVAARAFGFAARVLRWEGDKPKSGLAAAARAARYRLMGDAMRADGASLLVTAHHLTDQAETVLMRLGHGSGLGGLSGMTPLSTVEGVAVCRPLLGVEPARLEALARSKGLKPFADPGNLDQRAERVRVRGALAALDAAGIGAGAIARFAGRAARADAALETLTRDWLAANAGYDRFGVARLECDAFCALDPDMQVRALRRLLLRCGDGQLRALGPVEELAARLAAGEGGGTLGGAVVRQSGGRIVVHREAGRMDDRVRTVQPGEVFVFDKRYRIVAGAASLKVGLAGGMTRADAGRLFNWPDDAPVAALRALPLVTAENGEPLALGPLIRAARIDVSQIGTDW